MSIKDLINQAYNKDAGAFETTFKSVMDEKMGSAIEAKYDEMFGAQDVEEEVEVEEEVSEEIEVEEELDLEESKDEEEDEDEDEDEDDDDEEDED